MTIQEGTRIVNLFRKKYPRVPQLWYKSKDAMMQAIINWGNLLGSD